MYIVSVQKHELCKFEVNQVKWNQEWHKKRADYAWTDGFGIVQAYKAATTTAPQHMLFAWLKSVNKIKLH